MSAHKRGRQRFYRLASAQVAQAIEALLAVAPHQSASGLREAKRGRAIHRARTCYDHLAGRLGVSVAEALEREHAIAPLERGWAVTSRGEHMLGELGLELDALRRRRRVFLRPCLDWTEGRPHLAGVLGAAIAERFFALGWIERLPGSRAVRITPLGERQLLMSLAVRI